nr:cytidylate kinase family protein [Actinomycetota bacterium]
GLFGTVWAYKSLREIGRVVGGRLDWPGNLLFGIGLVAVLVGITYAIQPYGGSSMGWLNPMVLALLSGGVLLLAAFVVVETKVAQPMFDMGLFQIRAFAAGNIASLLASVGRGGLMFMLIIWLQGIWLPLHGYSFASTPLWAGIYMLPLTTGFLVAGPISGFLSDRFGARPFATGGMLAAALSFGLLMLLPANFSYLWFALLLLLNGLGMGLFTAPNTAGIMNSVPAHHRGSASGMRATFQNGGMTLSIGLFFSIMVVGLASNLPAALTRGLTAQGVSPSAAAKVAHLPPVSILFAAFLGKNPVSNLLGPAISTLSPAHRAVVTGPSFFAGLISGPFLHGLSIVFTFALCMCLVAAAASWLRGAKVTTAVGASAPRVEAAPGVGVLAGVGKGFADAPGRRVSPSAGTTVQGTSAAVTTGTRAWAAPAVGATGDHRPRVVTISASFGAGGSQVGPAVAARLALPFFDRAIPLQVSEHLGVSVDAAVAHDEHVQGTLVELLVSLIGAPVSFGASGLQTRPVHDEDAFKQATENVLWELASGTGGVVLGRAGALVLASCPGAVHVRLDGPPAARVERVALREGLSHDEAQELVDRMDQARTTYVHRLYGRDPGDADLYHLVIDSTAIPIDACIDTVVSAAVRYWDRTPVES